MISSVLVEDGDALERSEARLITFPDGVPRIISMKRRLWRQLDWLEANDGTGSIQETLEIAWQVASEFHDPTRRSFEEELRVAFKNAIVGCVSAIINHRNGVTHDTSHLG